MNSNEKIERYFLYWLNISLALVFFIIIVGGLTRLTNSGLSITEWELFEGIFPPLNQASWEIYFNKYKEIPQYKLLNPNMSMSEFKIIFYWEYFHRILARVLGLFFLIPVIIFYISKKIKKNYLNSCFLIFLLICLQGIVGWYMVKSGLVNDVTVSHYRLSIHLSIAIVIISSIYWVIKNFISNQNKVFFKLSNQNYPFQILIILILVQIIIGAFVSGLDAGKIYQTWPLMGKSYFPNDLYTTNFTNILEFNNHSLVQFYHRNLAYFIVLYILFLSLYILHKKIKHLYKPLKLLLFFIFLQAILGILTLVSGLNIFLASAHQITSVLLVFSAINIYHLRAK